MSDRDKINDEKAARDTLLRARSVPPKLHDRLADLRSTSAVKAARRFLESELTLLVLFGETGCSKSLAAAWAFEFADHRAQFTASGERRGPLWFDARALAAVSLWDPRIWPAFDGASLIVIDDAGIEDDATRLAAAIERGWNLASGRVLITTNLDRETFGARYGKRIASRLKERSAYFMPIADPDYRDAANALPDRRFPSPKDLTEAEFKRDAEAKAKERAAQEAWEASREANAVAIAAQWEEFRAQLDELEAKMTFARSATERADDERRRELRRQLQERGQEP